MKGCPVCLNGTSHLPAVWLGSWWTPVFFRGWTADMCDAGSGQTRTSLQMNPQSTGQTRSQISSQTLGNPGHFWMRRGSQRSTVSNRNTSQEKEPGVYSLGPSRHRWPAAADWWATGISWRKTRSLRTASPLLTKDEEPELFTFVRNLRWFLIGHCNEREHRFEFWSNIYDFCFDRSAQ